jgi:tetratricopeptide (TPR) repeat protein
MTRTTLLLLLWIAISAQIDPKTALLEKSGFDALRAGDAQAAATAFRDALQGDPKNARLHLGAGVAAFLQRRDVDAQASLMRAIELEPQLADAREVLGLVLHRRGDLSSAIREYETLVALAPARTAAAETLERWRRELELHSRMDQTVGHHFVASFEGPPAADLAARALESLDRAYWRIGGVLGVYPSDPIPVVLYTMEQFRDVTRAPGWAAGAYDGIIRVPSRGALERPAELDRVLAHEFTHALVRTLSSRAVPAWLNEGLAAALESDDQAWAERRVAAAGSPVPLRHLVGSFGRLQGEEAELAYASSALAVRRLIDEAGGYAVANLLRDLGNGADFESAFLHRIQRSFDSFAGRTP